MSSSNRHNPLDPLEGELSRRLVRTSPGLDSRFRSLRRQLEEEREVALVPPRRIPWFHPFAWSGAAAAAAGLAVAWLWLGSPQEVADTPLDPAPDHLFAEDPFTWDASLANALVLLDEATVETLLLFPYENES